MRLLCGVDASAPGRHAANVAAHFARRLGAELVLVHVVVPQTSPRDWRTVMARDVTEAVTSDLAQISDERRKVWVTSGIPAEELVRIGREIVCDLIIVGHSRRRPFAGALVDATHGRLLRTTEVPVMVVPPGADPSFDGPVMLACDVSTEPLPVAATAGRLAAALGAPLTVVNVKPRRTSGWRTYDVMRRHRDAAMVAGGRRLSIDYHERHGRPGEELAAAAAELDATAAVVAPREGSLRRRLFRRSVTKELTRRSHRPVVVVPPVPVNAATSRVSTPQEMLPGPHG